MVGCSARNAPRAAVKGMSTKTLTPEEEAAYADLAAAAARLRDAQRRANDRRRKASDPLPRQDEQKTEVAAR